MRKILLEDILDNVITLEEGLANVRKKYLDTGIFAHGPFTMVLDADTTPNKKYVDWLFKNIYKEYKNADGVVLATDIYDLMHTIPKQLATYGDAVTRNLTDKKDINHYKSLTAFTDGVESLAGVKSNTERKAEKRAEDAEDAIIICDNGEFRILIPTSVEGARRYSRGSDWCISYTNTSTYWNDYIHGERLLPYFVYSKQISKENDARHVCVMVSEGDEIHSVWDHADRQMDGTRRNDFFKFLTDNDIDVDDTFIYNHWDELAESDEEGMVEEALADVENIIDAESLEHVDITVDSSDDYEGGLYFNVTVVVPIADYTPTNYIPSDTLDTIKDEVDEYFTMYIRDVRYHNEDILISLDTDGCAISEAVDYASGLVHDANDIDESYPQILKDVLTVLGSEGLIDSKGFNNYNSFIDEIDKADMRDKPVRGFDTIRIDGYTDDNEFTVIMPRLDINTPHKLQVNIIGNQRDMSVRYEAGQSSRVKIGIVETFSAITQKTIHYDPSQTLLKDILPEPDNSGILSDGDMTEIREYILKSAVLVKFGSKTLDSITISPPIGIDPSILLKILALVDNDYDTFRYNLVDALNKPYKQNPFTVGKLTESTFNKIFNKVFG